MFQKRELGEFLELTTYGFTNPMPDADEGPWKVTAKDVIDGRINYQTARKTTRQAFENDLTDKSRPRLGDVLLTKDGTLGRLAVVREEGFCVNQSVAVLRPNQSILSDYLYYLLSSPKSQHQLIADSDGSVLKHIYITRVPKMEVEIPSLGVQRVIVNILKSLDDRIELNRQLNATLESMAQAFFKSWFVDFDPVIDNALEAHNPIPEPLQARAERLKALGDQRKPLPEHIQIQFPSSFVFSEQMGWVPEGWAVKPLKELTAKIGSGATPRGGKKVYQEEGISLIRSQNVYDSEFTWNGLAYISDEAATQLNGVTVDKEDVLLNITGASILRTCVVDPKVLPARVNQHVAIIRAKNGIPPRYLHLHMLQNRTKAYLMGQNAGASREAVTKGHIESVPTLSPTGPILEHFRAISEPLFTKKDNLAFNAKTLTSVRDTLLPKLLSGLLRIPDADKQVDQAI
jgi:type I restriction enzyme, S subunit